MERYESNGRSNIIFDPEDQLVARIGELNARKALYLHDLIEAQIRGGRKNRQTIRTAKREVRHIVSTIEYLTRR